VRWQTILLLSLLSACSSPDIYASYSSSDQPPLDDVVKAAVRTVVAQAKLDGVVEISPLRPAHRISPGEWLVCLRSTDPQPNSPYAVFFGHGKFLESRAAVLIDGCDGESYSPAPI
jgi:hypothetical protein